MKTCKSLPEAQAVEGVLHIHREADDCWLAYEEGDDIPQPKRDQAREQIAELEAQITLRMLSESALGIPGGRERLQKIQDQIAVLRPLVKT